MENPFIVIPPRWAACQSVVLHELAHIAAGPGAGHGPEYCAMYLSIVEKFLGGYNSRLLKESMDEHMVCYSPGEAAQSTPKAIAGRKQYDESKRAAEDARDAFMAIARMAKS
jgi:hypothetical protein